MVRYSASGGQVIHQNENPARVRGSGRGLGNPHLVGVRRAMLRGLRFGKRTGALEVPHAGIAFSTSAYIETRNPWSEHRADRHAEGDQPISINQWVEPTMTTTSVGSGS